MAEKSLSTQVLVDVDRIESGVLYLKDKAVIRILAVSGINFDLKSEPEQAVILNTFQGFLNSLGFPVQFFIHSRKVNVQDYLRYVSERKLQESNELLKIQIEEYVTFVRSFVEQNPIITKSFFVVVRYDPAPVNTSGGVFGIFSSILKPSSQQKNTLSDEYLVEQLQYRVDEVVGGLSQIGLHTAPLETQELMELFYNLYNPQLTDVKHTAS